VEQAVNFNELVKKVSLTTFSDIISISPRKVRESLFAHYGIKNKDRSILSSVKAKKEQRIKHLYDVLQQATKPKEQEFLKELFRNWLFRQRPLLKATLDYLGIENDNGLVEIETDFFLKLNDKQVNDLVNHLKPNFDQDAILIYLTFMEVPHLEKHLK
jgi:hypothetical protein